ncbi:MAG TPA: hypothetical protein DFR83_07415 [Deltaproteobacteria bacterium]|nr:hypothetical protein [Deltaproteobacteria bacterium]
MSSSSAPDRLDQIQQELASILEERLAALTTSLQATEATSRRIVATEMELQRAQQTQSRLTAEVAQLESGAQGFVAQRETLEAEHAQTLQEHAKQMGALEGLQQIIADASVENSSSRARLTKLEAQAEALMTENENLQAQLRTVEENISRMTALRDEIIHNIRDRSDFVKRLPGADGE